MCYFDMSPPEWMRKQGVCPSCGSCRDCGAVQERTATTTPGSIPKVWYEIQTSEGIVHLPGWEPNQ